MNGRSYLRKPRGKDPIIAENAAKTIAGWSPIATPINIQNDAPMIVAIPLDITILENYDIINFESRNNGVNRFIDIGDKVV